MNRDGPNTTPKGSAGVCFQRISVEQTLDVSSLRLFATARNPDQVNLTVGRTALEPVAGRGQLWSPPLSSVDTSFRELISGIASDLRARLDGQIAPPIPTPKFKLVTGGTH